jgi:RES domain-containing protein
MRAYRVAKRAYSALDGEGARKVGGRWNSPGHPMVYAATHLSLAILEQLVRLPTGKLPADYVWVGIDVPDDLAIEEVAASDLPGWDHPDRRVSRAFGDSWLRELRSAALLVPAVVVPQERNLLLNPRHAEIRRVTQGEAAPLVFDRRLFQR